MAEPILSVAAIAAMSGAAGGAAGRLLERGVDGGLDWIKSHLSKHGDAVQQRAEANAAEFLVELSTRVSRVERGLAAIDSDELGIRLSSPDFAAVLQSATIAAARTSDAARHKLLAQAVAKRLRFRDEDPLAIAEGLAVDIIPKLSKDQLAFLGLRHGLADLTQPRRHLVQEPATEFEHRATALRDRFSGVERLNAADYLHLASVSCALHGGGVTVWSLDIIFGKHRWENWDPRPHLRQFDSGRWLLSQWKGGAEKVTLTLVGATIAAHVFHSEAQSA